MSSSGHGQSVVRSKDDLQIAFKEAIEGSRGDVKEIIIEEFIEFDSEFTLLTVTQKVKLFTVHLSDTYKRMATIVKAGNHLHCPKKL